MTVRKVPSTVLANDKTKKVIYTPLEGEAVEETAQWTTGEIISIRDHVDHTAVHIREQLPKIYSRELVDTIFEQPYCRIGNLIEANIAKRQTASEYL